MNIRTVLLLIILVFNTWAIAFSNKYNRSNGFNNLNVGSIIDKMSLYIKEYFMKSMLFSDGEKLKNILLPECSAAVPDAENVSICYGEKTVLTASGGVDYRWYYSSNGGGPISLSNTFTTPELSMTTTYYVSNYDGCESEKRAVTVTVSGSFNVTISTLKEKNYNCMSEPELLSAAPAGGFFSGDAVESGYFVPSKTKAGSINTIYYTLGPEKCQVVDSLKVFVFQCNSLKDALEQNLSIYPNPTTGIVNIEMTGVEGLAIILVQDELGRKIVEERLQVTRSYYGSCDISALPTGIYVIKVIINDKSIIRKIVKQ